MTDYATSTEPPTNAQGEHSPSAGDLTIGTLWDFLRGDRRAILAIASARGALGLGFFFVISAGLAREYDNHDLVSEPWRMLMPLAASLGTSFILFSLLYVVARTGGSGRLPFLRTYPQFLTLYWITAPMAWFYAIPVERFLSDRGAMLTNLGLLTVVSIWRMVLMVRVAAVLCAVPRRAALWPVLLFADVVALAAIVAAPKPVFMAMAGVWSPQSEWTGAMIGFQVGAAGVVTLPIWLIAMGIAVARQRPWRFGFPSRSPAGKVARGAWGLVFAVLLSSAMALLWTQPEQRLRNQVESLIYSGRIDEAVQVMTMHQRNDFPPHWDPPPHPHDAAPRLLDVTDAILDAHVPEWVLAFFSSKLRGLLYDSALLSPQVTSDEEFDRYVRVVVAAPEGAALVWEKRRWLEALKAANCSDQRRRSIEQVLKLAEQYEMSHGTP